MLTSHLLRSSSGSPAAAPRVLLVPWCLCSDFFFLVLTLGLFTIRDCLKSFCGQSRSTIKHTGGNCSGWGGRILGRLSPLGSAPGHVGRLRNLHTQCLESSQKYFRMRICQVLALELQCWDIILWSVPLSFGLFKWKLGQVCKLHTVGKHCGQSARFRGQPTWVSVPALLPGSWVTLGNNNREIRQFLKLLLLVKQGLYEGRPKQTQNYLLEGVPLAVQASPVGLGARPDQCTAGVAVRGCVWLQ